MLTAPCLALGQSEPSTSFTFGALVEYNGHGRLQSTLPFFQAGTVDQSPIQVSRDTPSPRKRNNTRTASGPRAWVHVDSSNESL